MDSSAASTRTRTRSTPECSPRWDVRSRIGSLPPRPLAIDKPSPGWPSMARSKPSVSRGPAATAWGSLPRPRVQGSRSLRSTGPVPPSGAAKARPIGSTPTARLDQSCPGRPLPHPRAPRSNRCVRCWWCDGLPSRLSKQLGARSGLSLVNAPDRIRDRFRDQQRVKLIDAFARLRPAQVRDLDDADLYYALRALARRHIDLAEQIDELEQRLRARVAAANPPYWPSRASARSPAPNS